MNSFAEIKHWILTDGKKSSSADQFLYQLMIRLNNIDMHILRAVINVRTLHPEVGAITYQWYNENLNMNIPFEFILRRFEYRFEKGMVVENIIAHRAFDTEPYLNSPFHAVRYDRKRILKNFAEADEQTEYPIYDDMRTLGATSYYARELEFTSGEYNVLTWATAKQGGFSTENVEFLDALTPALAACIEIFAQKRITQTLLEIYLGENTGRAVLQGQIKRGDIRQLRAVIWFSDLRDFTGHTQRGEAEVVAMLNEYFEVVAEPLRKNGGEILKFIGDAILAIFAYDDDAPSAANAALRATGEAGRQLEKLNEKREAAGRPTLKHGIGLHLGIVKYGNIGSPDRLDFTVIGQAVNLASRLEGLCGKLGEPVLLSKEVASCLDTEVRRVGRYALKGIEEEQEVFAPGSE